MQLRWAAPFAVLASLAGCPALLSDFTIGETDGGSEGGSSSSSSGSSSSGGTGSSSGSGSGSSSGSGGSSGGHTDAGDANCGNTQTDLHNCGSCGHDCLGGQCQQGVCQPVQIASGLSGTFDGGGTFAPYYIAVDATDVYWNVVNLAVMKCSKTGCANQPVTLASGAPNTGIAIDSASVYWIDQGVLKTCAKTGCAGQPATLVSGLSAYAFAVGGGSIFIANGGGPVAGNPCDGASCAWLSRCSTAGCSGQPTVLYSMPSGGTAGLAYLAIDSTNVYASYLGPPDPGVFRCALSGCGGTPSTIYSAMGAGPGDITADGANAYWLDSATGQVKQCAIGGCNNQPTTLYASGGQGLSGIAVDGSNVYWCNVTTGAIQRCAIGGCNNAPTNLVIGQNRPIGLTLDMQAVYWTTEGDGTVMKLAK